MIKRKHLLIGGSVILVLVCGGLWFRSFSSQPKRVFWDMMSNNLSTSGVTRVVSQNSNAMNVSQYMQLNLGVNPTAHSLTILKQGSGTIETEQISNRGNDFVRYKDIVIGQKAGAGKPIDVSSVVGKWARLGKDDALSSAVTSGLFDQSLLGIVPIANLQPEARNRLLTYMKDNDVFGFDAAAVKHTTLDGRRVYAYDISIQPAVYVALMQQFSELVGATQYSSLDPTSYAGAAAQKATFYVDVASHELSSISQTSSGHTETYKGFGIVSHTSLPKADFSTTELEKRITNLR
ncbi:MAG TPA: hypothetical protein VIJ25_21360 [Methylococcales bacterium]